MLGCCSIHYSPPPPAPPPSPLQPGERLAHLAATAVSLTLGGTVESFDTARRERIRSAFAAEARVPITRVKVDVIAASVELSVLILSPSQESADALTRSLSAFLENPTTKDALVDGASVESAPVVQTTSVAVATSSVGSDGNDDVTPDELLDAAFQPTTQLSQNDEVTPGLRWVVIGVSLVGGFMLICVAVLCWRRVRVGGRNKVAELEVPPPPPANPESADTGVDVPPARGSLRALASKRSLTSRAAPGERRSLIESHLSDVSPDAQSVAAHGLTGCARPSEHLDHTGHEVELDALGCVSMTSLDEASLEEPSMVAAAGHGRTSCAGRASCVGGRRRSLAEAHGVLPPTLPPEPLPAPVAPPQAEADAHNTRRVSCVARARAHAATARRAAGLGGKQ